MNKKLLLLSFLAVFALTGFAKQRTESEALNIARSFYEKSSKLRSGSSLTLAYAGKNGAATRSAGSNAHYYIFNKGGDGFVIVSGDDRAKEILGYSDESAFDYATAPENFKYWLDFYSEEIKSLAGQPEKTSQFPALKANNLLKAANSFATSIAPLLGDIKWDQGAPYNLLCPSTSQGKTVTGCVATAMAQVMKYYEWPVQGTGSNTYTPPQVGTPLTVDFSQTAYDWANMTPTYNASSTQAQKDAVATLMYHCGVAVDMDYDVSSNGGSGAYQSDMTTALMNYFGYDSHISMLLRDYYTQTEWTDIVKTELNAARPVLYGGSSSGGGHQFVCDGYDSNSYFHINWGWSGSSNGYFELSALSPGSLGIGGGSGGYNNGQTITVGIQKPNPAATSTYLIIASNYQLPSNTTRNSSFTFGIQSCINRGVTTISGVSYRIELRDASDNFVTSLYDGYNLNFPPNGGYNISVPSCTIPGSVTAGNYKLYYTFKASDQSEYWPARLLAGTPQCVNVQVTATDLIFTAPTENLPNLTLNTFTVAGSGNLYQNKTGRFNVSITNTGGGDYNSYLLLALASGGSANAFSQDPVVIPAGETKTYILTGNIGDTSFATGTYTAILYYDKDNNKEIYSFPGSLVSLGNIQGVEVKAAPALAPSFVITSPLTFPDNNAVVENMETTLSVTVKNTGGYYEGQFITFFFDKVTPGQQQSSPSIGYFGPYDVFLDTNEEVSYNFTETMNLPPDSYRTRLYYRSPSSWEYITDMLPFTVIPNTSTALQPAVADADPVVAAQYYDLLGKEVKLPQKGSIYILKQTHQSKKVSVKKVIEN